MLGVESSCGLIGMLDGKVGMVTKGWAVGGVGRGLGSSGLAGGRGFVAVVGDGSGRACLKIFLSIPF